MASKTGMILAAGMGKRLGAISQETPKPLLPVAGKTLIEYMIDFVKGLGCDRVIVVGGYMYEKVEAVVKKYDSSVEMVNNPRFDLQNLVSFKAGLDMVESGDLFVCNADYIFRQGTIDAVKASMEKMGVYCSYDLSGNADDVMKVQTDEDRNLIEMSKQLTEFNSIYTGMFFFPEDTVASVKSTTEELLETVDQVKATVEYLFPALMQKGHNIQVADCGKADWFEIDNEEEWMIARKALEQ